MRTTERVVSYWAVQGDRWCNVDQLINEERAEQWAKDGWRIVTRVIERPAPIFGELQNMTTEQIFVEFEE